MKPSVAINRIAFSDGSNVSLNENDILVFVGPNNVGKSHSLQAIYSLFKETEPSSIIVKSISYKIGATSDELKAYVREVSAKKIEYNSVRLVGYGYTIDEYRLDHADTREMEKKGLGSLRGLFVNCVTTDSRLELSTPPASINLVSDGAKHPIHMIQKNDELEELISSYFSSVFGLDLLVHRNAGQIVPLYVGKKPHTNGRDRTSHSYLLDLEALDQLATQGDGMRSFASILLNVFVSEQSVIVIDEPEAFLHPPQVRALGKIIGKDLPPGKQLFLATHSQDFIKGLLDANSHNVKIIRIDRNQNENTLSLISSDLLGNLWKNSFIRYSNVINGLFHTKIVICESDSDVQFYSAMLDTVFESKNRVSPDYLFIQSGGKDRVPGIIECAKSFNSKVSVVLDIDALQNDLIEKIYSLLGGASLPDLSRHLKIVRSAIATVAPSTVDEIREQILKVLAAYNDKAPLDHKLKSGLSEVLKERSPWTEFKKIGETYIPNGNATTSLRNIFQLLEVVNVFLVSVGELENFVPSIPHHGPRWLASVFERNLADDPELKIARDFVGRI